MTSNLISPGHHQPLRPLLDHLAQKRDTTPEVWQDWRINPVTGGRNNLLYRATGPAGDFAIKFTMPDDRQRATREYGALVALQQAGLDIAPTPVLIEPALYAHAVVVQTWLEGEVIDAPPDSDGVWLKLLRHLVSVHALTPAQVQVPLRADLDARTVAGGRALVQQQMRLLPSEGQPASLQQLIRRFEATSLPEWPEAAPALRRGDSNILNFIRRPGPWASVDWEYSGWGDPAFEIAELMAHPAYTAISPTRWDWVLETYCALVKDSPIAVRIRTYYKILLVWWVARWARILYEVPRGLDQRLGQGSAYHLKEMEARYTHYLNLATTHL